MSILEGTGEYERMSPCSRKDLSILKDSKAQHYKGMKYNMILSPHHFSLASQLPTQHVQARYMKSRCFTGSVDSTIWTSLKADDVALSSQHLSLLLNSVPNLYNPPNVFGLVGVFFPLFPVSEVVFFILIPQISVQ